MDAIPALMFFAIILCISALVISIPSLIAKNRGLSDEHRKTVLLLAILGIFFGVTWLVALILACVYPPAPRRIQRPFVRPKSFDPIPASFAGNLDSELDEDLAFVERETCQNCERVIGKLETPSVWKDHIVCAECYAKLAKQRL